MRKFNTAVLLVLLSLFTSFALPKAVSAKDVLMHSATPTTKETTISTQVINVSSTPQKALICAEAIKSGKQWNLGCHQVGLNSFQNHEWGERMNVYLRDEMPSGIYTVFFTYQDQTGKWHELKNVQTNQRARVSVNKGQVTLSQDQPAVAVENDLRHSYAPKKVEAKKDIDPSNSVQTKIVNTNWLK